MTQLTPERAALRDRLGKGARYDAPEAPAEPLQLARLGTAAVSRLIVGLSDAALYDASSQMGVSRAHLIAALSLQARVIARQGEAITNGTPPEVAPDAQAARDEVMLASTLPPRALRHLFDHAAIHLDVVWRDLPGSAWTAVAYGPSGQRPMSATPDERARALWAATLCLGAGGRASDLPSALRAPITKEPGLYLPQGLPLQG